MHQVMASVFIFTFCLSPAVINASQGLILTNATEWVDRFEDTVVTFREQGYGRALMEFKSGSDVFAIKLLSAMDPKLEHWPKVTVDNTEIPREQYTAKIKLLKGSVMKNGRHYSALVKITSEGLEGIVRASDDCLVLEPDLRYHETAGARRIINSDRFHCILYRGSDMKTDINSLLGRSTFVLDKDNVRIPHRNPKKRSTRNANQTVCALHIIAEKSFYTTTGLNNTAKTISEMLFAVGQADEMFRYTDFDLDGSPDNIGFQVSQIDVETTQKNYTSMTNSATHLATFTSINTRVCGACVAIGFTSLTFDGNALGNSYIGTVCQRSNSSCKNTGVVTNLNFGVKQPGYRLAMILAHEFGHIFGSDHDSYHCVTRNAAYGKYLMYINPTSAFYPNNYLYSPCSVHFMYQVIQNLGTCLQTPPLSFCGNGVTEEGEDCDCGTTSTCNALDPCCTPSGASSPAIPCTYLPPANCSPKADVCCTTTCTVTPASDQKICKAATECSQESRCDGVSKDCPFTLSTFYETPCVSENVNCFTGLCLATACLTLGLETCYCPSPYDCYRCCSYYVNGSFVCKRYLSYVGDYKYQETGTLCYNAKGKCDGKGKCVTLTKQVQTAIVVDSHDVSEWLQKHWVYVAAGGFVFLIIVGVVVVLRKRFSTTTNMHGHTQFI